MKMTNMRASLHHFTIFPLCDYMTYNQYLINDILSLFILKDFMFFEKTGDSGQRCSVFG